MYDRLTSPLMRSFFAGIGVLCLAALLQAFLLADVAASHGAIASGAVLFLYGIACLAAAFFDRPASVVATPVEDEPKTIELRPQKNITDEDVAGEVFTRITARYYQAQMQGLSFALNSKGFRFTTDQSQAVVPFFSLPHSIMAHAAEALLRERVAYIYPSLGEPGLSEKSCEWMSHGFGEKNLQDTLTVLKEMGFYLEQFDQAASMATAEHSESKSVGLN